ncbi:inositol 1,4,5-trisphosphate receptor-interacting protein [Triplophysa rosa]|uniref:Inositol 1,4,5-trisphosphate receptor-interacting protein n=1 Tax=Triplophysa rosa TaxID=992332 RepID=A0A9W7WZB8_TRIRA|nr:inositol 1,4,5-trisphosphate receptor-interacting protein [Triplophysa rosa]KAI7810964.1 putative inositol 1 [Triplophysa rosa]
MEDTFLNALVVVVSLLLSIEHNVIHDLDDNVVLGMKDHERVLLQEGEKLEELSIARNLPHSNWQASQNPGGEGDVSDVKQMLPNVRTVVQHEEQMSPVGDQNYFRQTAFAPDDQEKLDVSADWTSHMSNMGQIDIDQKGSNVDQNFSQGDEELLEKPKTGHIDTHHDNQAWIMGQLTAYSWYLWKALSLISLIRFLKWVVKLDFKPRSKTPSFLNGKNATFLNTKVSEIDCKTLTSFYDQCVQVPASKSWHICAFVEGFANDLLETMRNARPDVKIEDFVGVGSLYEQWPSRKSLVCDLHIPIIPPKPYSFEFELLRDRTTLYSSVNMVKGTDSSICICNDSNLGDDTLCLLHPDNKTDNIVEDYMNHPLCHKDSPYLSKTRAGKWFRNAVKKAWEEISHKYDFEIIFRNAESPGSLKVRFRSGKAILFNITPVVRFQDSEAHLISYLSSIMHLSDTHWPVCFARYENSLLQHLTKTLPRNSCHIRCLQILSFLHKYQIGLTGRCGLTSYHLKNALLHRLLDAPSLWRPEQIGHRLDDVLTFLQQRVKAKVLHHALLGNSLIPSEFGFPKEFREGKPINLFQPLLSNEELCFKTERHLVEITKNIPVLIYEYSTK